MKTFNDTLWNDLDNAGIFDMLRRAFLSAGQPSQPGEVKSTPGQILLRMWPCWLSGTWVSSDQTYQCKAGLMT